MQQLRQYAGESGRSVDGLSLAPATKLPQVTLDDLKQYRDAGVRQATVRLPTANPEHIEAALDDLAERLWYTRL